MEAAAMDPENTPMTPQEEPLEVAIPEREFLKFYDSTEPYGENKPPKTQQVADFIPHIPYIYFSDPVDGKKGRQIYVNACQGAYTKLMVQLGTWANPVKAPYGFSNNEDSKEGRQYEVEDASKKEFHISTDGRPELYRFAELLEEKILVSGIEHSEKWFGRRRTRAGIEEGRSFCKILRGGGANKKTGKVYAPTIRLKFATEGPYATRCFKRVPERDPVTGEFLKTTTGALRYKPEPCHWSEFDHKGIMVLPIIELRPLYLGQTFGVPLQITDILLYPQEQSTPGAFILPEDVTPVSTYQAPPAPSVTSMPPLPAENAPVEQAMETDSSRIVL